MGLNIENSWHFDGGLWQDKDLIRVKESQLKYWPTPIGLNEFQVDTVWTLRGPRRVGKTVALKLLVVQLIESKGISGNEIVWTSVETLKSTRQLLDHLLQILIEKKPRYLFCDEITNIVGWQNVIKKLRDEGRLSNCALALTGSSSFDLKAGSERLAGRKGIYQSTDRVLVPMSYQDFIAQSDQLNFNDYLHCGGFPFRVNEQLNCQRLRKKFDPQFGLSVFDDVFFYEFIRRRLDRNIALEIIGRIASIQSTACSYTSIANSLNVKGETVKKYLDVLGDAFLLATIYSYDSARSRVALKKDKKLNWIDPAFGYLPYFLGQGEIAQEGYLAECVVGTHLLRQYELRLFEGISAPCNVFTWKSARGNELDFLVVNKAQKICTPYEVKYQESVSPWDLVTLEKSFKTGYCLTKKTKFERSTYTAIPIQDFLTASGH